MSPPDEKTLHKADYQAFYYAKQKELYTNIYPICMESCDQKQIKSEKADAKLVFQEKDLKCTLNCVQKYKTSMNLALGLLQIEHDERWLTDNWLI